MRPKLILALAGAAALAWLPAAASAGTLQVNPVLLEIDAGRRTATLTVRNHDPAPVTIRAHALAWRQAGGEDIYEETAAVIVSPPIFTIPPGGTQLVRVGLRAPSAAAQAYRLIIEEVPEAAPVPGIRVALRLNLPFYANLPAGQADAVRWSARRVADGWEIEADNAGTGYVRLDPAAAQAATGIRFADTVAFGTVLPGGTRRWTVGAELDIVDRARFARIAGRETAAASRD